MTDYIAKYLPVLQENPVNAALLSAPLVTLPLLYNAARPTPIPGIPTDTPSPFTGHLVPLVASVAKTNQLQPYFIYLLDKYKAGISQVLMGSGNPIVLVGEYDLCVKVLSGKDFDRGPSMETIWSGLTPQGMLTLKTDATLRYHRRTLAPSMSPFFLEHILPLTTKRLDQLFSIWEKKAKLFEGVPFDVYRDVSWMNADNISEITFAQSFAGLNNVEAEVDELLKQKEAGILPKGPIVFKAEKNRMAENLDTLANSLTPGLFAAERHSLQRLRPSFKRARKEFYDWLKVQIRNARARTITDNPNEMPVASVMDIVLKWEKRDKLEGTPFMDDDALTDELLIYMIGGDDTTTATISWLMNYLAENPDIQRKLHESLKDVLPASDDRHFTYSEIMGSNLDYLSAVVEETLRCSHPFCFTPRHAIVDTVLTTKDGSSYPVKKGQTIFALLGYSNDHDQPRGDKFQPEAWLDENGKFDATRSRHLSFGGGARVCFGRRMAELFLRTFVAQFSLRYFIDSQADEFKNDGADEPGLTKKPKKTMISLKKWDELKA